MGRMEVCNQAINLIVLVLNLTIILIGDAKLKPASGSPGSGENVPVDNNPANSNPKNQGGSAGGGDGSGSPPLGGGPSKTDGGSSSDNGKVY
jgi:hypothetical protein